MFSRTQGNWTWAFSEAPETRGQPGIFVDDCGEDNSPLTPSIGDLRLMAYAPAMNERLWHTLNELNQITFLVPSEKIVGLTEIYEKIGKLLAAINVAPPEGIPAEIVSEVKQFYTEV